MSNEKISPISIATAGFIGATAFAGVNKASKFVAKKIADIPQDSFISKTKSFVSEKISKASNSSFISKFKSLFTKESTEAAKKAAQNIEKNAVNAAEKLASAKETVGKFAKAKKAIGEFFQARLKNLTDANDFISKKITNFSNTYKIGEKITAAKTYITTKATKFINSQAFTKIKNIIKSPLFIGAMVGIGLYVIAKKVISKLQTQE